MRKMPRVRRRSSAVSVKLVSAAPDVAASSYRRDSDHLYGSLPCIILYWLNRELVIRNPPRFSAANHLYLTGPALTLANHLPSTSTHPAWTQDSIGTGLCTLVPPNGLFDHGLSTCSCDPLHFHLYTSWFNLPSFSTRFHITLTSLLSHSLPHLALSLLSIYIPTIRSLFFSFNLDLLVVSLFPFPFPSVSIF